MYASSSAQKGVQQPGCGHSGSTPGSAQKRPGAHWAICEQSAPYPPDPGDASGRHVYPPSIGVQSAPSAHASGASGSQLGRQRMSTPSFETEQNVPASAQVGSSGDPSQRPTQVPVSACGSTHQHIAPASHESIPLAALPSTVHGSPGLPGIGSTGTHLTEFHVPPPSSAHALHFCPSGQSLAHRSHCEHRTCPGSPGTSTHGGVVVQSTKEHPVSPVVDVLVDPEVDAEATPVPLDELDPRLDDPLAVLPSLAVPVLAGDVVPVLAPVLAPVP